MSVFSLTISSLTMSSLPWFMDLKFQVPMKYHSLQHWTLLSPLDTSTTERHSCFCPTTSFSLELLVIALCSSPVAYWRRAFRPGSGEGAHLPVSYLFVFSYCSLGSCGKNTGVGCCFLPQCTVLHNPSLCPICLGWPCTAWLIASLSYTSPCTMTRLWSMKGIVYYCMYYYVNYALLYIIYVKLYCIAI